MTEEQNLEEDTNSNSTQTLERTMGASRGRNRFRVSATRRPSVSRNRIRNRLRRPRPNRRKSQTSTTLRPSTPVTSAPSQRFVRPHRRRIPSRLRRPSISAPSQESVSSSTTESPEDVEFTSLQTTETPEVFNYASLSTTETPEVLDFTPVPTTENPEVLDFTSVSATERPDVLEYTTLPTTEGPDVLDYTSVPTTAIPDVNDAMPRLTTISPDVFLTSPEVVTERTETDGSSHSENGLLDGHGGQNNLDTESNVPKNMQENIGDTLLDSLSDKSDDLRARAKAEEQLLRAVLGGSREIPSDEKQITGGKPFEFDYSTSTEAVQQHEAQGSASDSLSLNDETHESLSQNTQLNTLEPVRSTVRASPAQAPAIIIPNTVDSTLEKVLGFVNPETAELARQGLKGWIKKKVGTSREKTAVFVRRRPDGKPEVVGRGKVVSHPGGKRQLVVEARPDEEDIELLENIPFPEALTLGPDENLPALDHDLSVDDASFANQSPRQPATVHITTPKPPFFFSPSPRGPNPDFITHTSSPPFPFPAHISQSAFRPEHISQPSLQSGPTTPAPFQPALTTHRPLEPAPTPGVWSWQTDATSHTADSDPGVDFHPPISGWQPITPVPLSDQEGITIVSLEHLFPELARRSGRDLN